MRKVKLRALKIAGGVMGFLFTFLTGKYVAGLANLASIYGSPPGAYAVGVGSGFLSPIRPSSAATDQHAPPPGETCDRLAADPEDIGSIRSRAGVPTIDDPAAVVAACSAAINLEPGVAKYWDQRGRAQEALRHNELALADYKRASDLGYGVAKARWADHLWTSTKDVTEMRAAFAILHDLQDVSTRALFRTGESEGCEIFHSQLSITFEPNTGRSKMDRARELGFGGTKPNTCGS